MLLNRFYLYGISSTAIGTFKSEHSYSIYNYRFTISRDISSSWNQLIII